MANGTKYAIAAVVVIIIIVGGFLVLFGGSFSNGSGTSTPVLMTDPATVPAGTSAVVMSYSSMKVQETNASGSAWVSASGSGNVNLMAIQNSSQVIGYANVAANSSISAVQFVVTSTTITVNGTTKTVSTPNSTVTAQVSSGSNTQIRSNSSAAIVVNYVPTVTASGNSSANATYTMTASTNAEVMVNVNLGASLGVGVGSIVATVNSISAGFGTGLIASVSGSGLINAGASGNSSSGLNIG